MARNDQPAPHEDTNLFGGAFTPFRDIWNSVAADMGITTKRMRENALAQAAEEEAIWRDTDSSLREELARQRGATTNPDDLAQLRTLETQMDMAGRMRSSSNPKLMEAGVQLVGKIADEQRAFNDRQETQRIAEETRLASIEREVGQEAFTRMQGIADDLRNESGSFLKQREQWGTVNAALSLPPSAASDMALIFSFMKVLDPQSVVREGEFATAANAGGVPDIMMTAYNNLLRDGQRLTADQRKSFYDQARQMYLTGAEAQRERNGRYLERARASDVPEKYHDSLTIPVELATPPVDFGPDGSARPAAPVRSDDPRMGNTYEDLADSTSRQIGDSVREGAKTAGGRAAEFFRGLVNSPGRSQVPTEYGTGGTLEEYEAPRRRRPVND